MKLKPGIVTLSIVVMLLAGCSSTAGQPTAAATNLATTGSTSSSQASSSASTSEASSESSETTTEETTTSSETSSETTSEDTSTSEETTESVTPAELDAASTAWLVLFCDGISQVGQYVSPDTSGQDLAQGQTTLVDAYANIAASAEDTRAKLEAQGAPTFENGEAVQEATLAQLAVLVDAYGRGSETIRALAPAGPADLEAAVEAVEADASALLKEQQASAVVPPPDVQAAARLVPECQNVF